MLPLILNSPYTLIGLLVALLSGATKVRAWQKPITFIITVKSFWWALGSLKGARAATIGHIVILGPKLEANDLEHELVHVRQHEQRPIIQPFLYIYENIRNGYRNNKYEIEAYKIAGNIYKE